MGSEIIVLVGGKERETGLIRRLISSFDLQLHILDSDAVPEHGHLFRSQAVCLVILQAEGNHGRQLRKLRWLRKQMIKPVPVLVLLPEEWVAQSGTYIKAGADDFCLLPLHEGRFSVRFLILLECGQAMVHATVPDQGPIPDHGVTHAGPRENAEVWYRIVEFLREGLSFFSPGIQVSENRHQPIFNRWERVERLGSGGDGVVWKVREIGTGRAAVAKIPHGREMNAGVLRAAAILKRLIHHPNVVHLIEVVREGERFVLIQEYVPGDTLSFLVASA